MGINTLLEEILDCEDEIYKLNEYKPRIFRPPEGVLGNDVITAAELLEYDVILWSVDTRDWDNTPSETIIRNIVDNVKSGDIILMHDYIGHNSPTPAALNEIIPILIAKGFEFVTVSELM